MIASVRGLVILTAIAAVLGAIVAIDGRGGAVVEERRLVPALVTARVQAIELSGGPDGLIRIERDEHGGWRVTGPSPGPAEAAAVTDLLGAIAAARWERRAPADLAPRMQRDRTLTLVTDGTRTTLHFGDDVPGAQQTWARVDGGPALLVPSWVAAAASRGLTALRESQLVRTRSDAVTGFELHGRGVDVVTSGAIAIVHLDAGAARVRADAMARLTAAVAAVHTTAFPRAATTDDVTLTLRVLGGTAPDELTARGPCPGRAGDVEVEGTAGVACVAAARLDAVVDAARAIPTSIDPAPLQGKPIAQLAWASGAIVTAAGGGFTIGGARAAADDDAVHAAIDALTTPAASVDPLPSGAHAAATAALEVRYTDGTTDALEEVDTPTRRALRRRGEPFMLRVAEPALAAIALTTADLRDRALISEEPAALAALDVAAGARHAHAARGATLGDWTGDLDGAAVLAAAETIAHLRAARFVDPKAIGPIALTIRATFAAPPVAGAQPTTHTIELSGGASASAGATCTARVDAQAVRLDADRCATLRALATAAAVTALKPR